MVFSDPKGGAFFFEPQNFPNHKVDDVLVEVKMKLQ